MYTYHDGRWAENGKPVRQHWLEIAFANDEGENPEEFFTNAPRDGVQAKSLYGFDTHHEMIEAWFKMKEDPEGMWYWVTDHQTNTVIMSGACDPGDIEWMQDTYGWTALPLYESGKCVGAFLVEWDVFEEYFPHEDAEGWTFDESLVKEFETLDHLWYECRTAPVSDAAKIALEKLYRNMQDKVQILYEERDGMEPESVRLPEELPTWLIPCYWECSGTMAVKARSLEEAIDLAVNGDTPLPDGNYVDGSFEVSELGADYIREAYNNGQQDLPEEEEEER